MHNTVYCSAVYTTVCYNIMYNTYMYFGGNMFVFECSGASEKRLNVQNISFKWKLFSQH